MIAIVITVIMLLALMDFPRLIHEKKWYEVSVLSVIYVFVLTLAILQAADVVLPNPAKGLGKFITEVLHLGYSEV